MALAVLRDLTQDVCGLFAIGGEIARRALSAGNRHSRPLVSICVDWSEAVALIFGALAVAFTLPSSSGFIERQRCVLPLMLYAAYLSTLRQRHG